MTLRKLSIRFKGLSKDFPEKANALMRRVALAVDQSVVISTPVDTGRARSNWIVSIGSDNTAVIDAYVQGSALGVGEGGNAREALAQGRTALLTRRSGQTIFLSNNVPYIQRLNDGHSAQAPINFIETAIMEGVRAIGEVRLADL